MSLPDQTIFQWISDPGQSWKWTPPPVPDFAGPDDLARLLFDYRQRLGAIRLEGGRPDVTLGGISDKALAPLIRVAYRASFLTEEGRPVRGCLHAPPSYAEVLGDAPGHTVLGEIARSVGAYFAAREAATRNTFQLTTPLKLDDPKHIARFAPTLAAEDAVLTVREEGGEVVSDGIALLDSRDFQNNLLQMPRGWTGVGGLFVQILSPGELRVSEGGLEYTLRANTIRVYSRASSTEPVRRWHEGLAEDLVGRCRQQPGWNEKHIGEPISMYASIDVMSLWSRILREAATLRHGGAFVVVPDISSAPVTPKYPLRPIDLGCELGEAWLSLCRAWECVERRHESVIDRLEDKRCQIHKLCSAVRSVGHLAATDGCVVLDRALVVHGFGGSIQATDGQPRSCFRIHGDAREEIDERTLLLPFGERHKSAFRLCKRTPGSMVFVISQDGDLRVFASDETSVTLYDLLYP